MGGRMGGVSTPERSIDVKVRLFLEGDDDVDVLWKRWIKGLPLGDRDLPQITAVEPAGGCEKVVKRVEGDLHDRDVIAMGLVDRDALIQPKFMADGMPVFLERDDHAFGTNAPGVFGAKLARQMWVLPYWEMENLVLLYPKLIREHQEVSKAHGPSVVIKDDAQALDLLIDLAERLRPYFAALLHAREKGKKVSIKGINKAKQSEKELREEIELACAAWLDKSRLGELEQALLAFDDHAGQSLEARWRRMCRAVDGKTMLQVLCDVWTKDSTQKMKRLLALLISKEHGPPPELVSMVNQMRGRAEEIAKAPIALDAAD